MKLILVILIFLGMGQGFAQVILEKKTTQEITKNISENHQIISLGNQGLLLVQESLDILRSFKQEIILLHYDSNLNTTWRQNFALDYDAKIDLFTIDANFLYLLIKKPNFEHQILQIQISDGLLNEIPYKKMMNFDIKYFQVQNQVIYMGGKVNSVPVVLEFNPNSSRPYKILPNISQQKAELVQMSLQGKYLVTLLHNPYQNEQILQAYIFEDGQSIAQWQADNLEKYYIVDAKVFAKNQQHQYIFGTYALTKQGKSQGIYVAFIENNEQKYMHFYDFAVLKNYLNYLPEKRKNRIYAKIEKRKAQQKKYAFEHHIQIKDLLVTPQRIFLLGENYLPIYGATFNSQLPLPATLRGNNLPSQRIARGRNADTYRFRNAFVAAFDYQGKMLWDNAFEFENKDKDKLESGFQIALNKDSAVMLMLGENKVLHKNTYKSEKNMPINHYNLDSLSLKMPQVNREQENLIHWYDNYFLLYGIEALKNVEAYLPRRYIYLSKMKAYWTENKKP